MITDPINSCRNCKNELNGLFCSNCGQKVKEADNRSIGNLLSQLFSNLFFLDNRIWVSIKHLFFKPGIMAKEYVSGRRKKFIPPITLFLFINVIYFFVSPSSDYSLSLYDQMNQKIYSEITNQMVNSKIESSHISLEEYSKIYNKNSLKISKSLMILNIPILAAFLYLLTFKIRKFYYDSLIFSMHFFSFFLFCTLINYFTKFINTQYGITQIIFMLLVPMIYSIIGIRNFYHKKWLYFLPTGILCFMAIFIALFLFQAIIFGVTYFLT